MPIRRTGVSNRSELAVEALSQSVWLIYASGHVRAVKTVMMILLHFTPVQSRLCQDFGPTGARIRN